MLLAELVIKYQIEKTSKHKTEIGEIISEFVDEINAERLNTKYPQVKFMQIYSKLGAINKDKFALSQFLSNCKDYKRRNGSFSKCFYGATKTK